MVSSTIFMPLQTHVFYHRHHGPTQLWFGKTMRMVPTCQCVGGNSSRSMDIKLRKTIDNTTCYIYIHILCIYIYTCTWCLETRHKLII
jgi:hypothetical protein